MRRIGTWAAAAVLGAGVLAGCGGGDDSASGGGGNDTDSYCDALKDAQDDFSSLGAGDAGAFEEFVQVAQDLGDEAPDEVADDWKKINDAFADLETKLNEAGIQLDDLDELQQGQVPEGADQQKLMELSSELNAFGAELNTAGDNISKHAKDECDIDLDSSSPSPSPSE